MLSVDEFGIHGRVAFYGRASLAKASLEDSLELMNGHNHLMNVFLREPRIL